MGFAGALANCQERELLFMIPDYQSIMLPLQRYISDNKEHKMRDVTDGLAKQLGVTEEEKKELLPSGAAPVSITERLGQKHI
jgi:restriction endonuclease Mrr